MCTMKKALAWSGYTLWKFTAWHKAHWWLLIISVHFMRTHDLSTLPVNRLAHNISWASYCHHVHYRDSREHRYHLLCWKGQQKLVEPSPSLPASAIAELIACKNFQACLFLLIQSYLQAHFTYIFYCCLTEIFEVIFVLLLTFTAIASAWACIVDSDNWSYLNK